MTSFYKSFSLLFLLSISSIIVTAQPGIEWQKSFGGLAGEEAYAIQNTSDGGFITAGYASSSDGDVTNYHGGGLDFWIVKMSSTGTMQWQKCLGGSSYEDANSIIQTTDGGYMVVGASNSNDGDVSGQHGAGDYWVVKLSSTGTIEWQKTYGGSNADYAQSVVQTTDGGYLILGTSSSINGDVSGNHYIPGSLSPDYWLVKINSTGVIQWSKCLGGSNQEGNGDLEKCSESLKQTPDGGFIMAGFTYSNNGDVSGNHVTGSADYWIVKMNNVGTIEWQQCYGGTNDDIATGIALTTDGGYVVSGSAKSNNGNVSGNHVLGTADHWIIKLNSSGALQWQKCFGGPDNDYGRAIQATTDGGYIIAGVGGNNGGDITGYIGSFDYWIVKLTSTGTLEWQRSLGSSSTDHGYALLQSPDGGYVIAGEARSSDHDVTGNHNSTRDFWIVKLRSTILPLHLISFTAKAINNKDNLLQWTTTAEENLQYYEVEYRLAGSTFQVIGKVAAKNNLYQNQYSFTHANANNQTAWYRLKIVEKDGQFSYSKNVVVKANSLDKNDMVYNNTTSNLQVVTKAGLSFSLRIYNATGQLILSKQLTGEMLNNIPVSQLAKGTYVASLSDGQTQVTYRFVR